MPAKLGSDAIHAKDFLTIGFEYLQGREYDLADHYFRRSLACRPTICAARLYTAVALLRGNLEAAFGRSLEAIQVDWRYDSPWVDAGELLIMLEREREALGYLRQALAVSKRTVTYLAHFYLGQAYERLGLRRLAREHYQTSRALEPGYDQARIALARITSTPR